MRPLAQLNLCEWPAYKGIGEPYGGLQRAFVEDAHRQATAHAGRDSQRSGGAGHSRSKEHQNKLFSFSERTAMLWSCVRRFSRDPVLRRTLSSAVPAPVRNAPRRFLPKLAAKLLRYRDSRVRFDRRLERRTGSEREPNAGRTGVEASVKATIPTMSPLPVPPAPRPAPCENER